MLNTKKLVTHLRPDLISEIQRGTEISLQLRLLTHPRHLRLLIKDRDQPCFQHGNINTCFLK